ncbi:DMT family transporter [Sporohalobacter salinus]|uniref:DMT family transporter n=1 Tax=Sporohalobacter salinus TaxID=1494606 RepID=UPI00195F4761|nr:DMT family transporter [Sporohalobacter salinus]MBM7622726.1 drug/metabolite transporter (DMT)-like permease [Sporohalobacter salinus]
MTEYEEVPLKRRVKADLALLLVVFVWGTTFAIMKDVFSIVTPFYFLTLRFSTAVLVLILIFHRRLKKLDLETIKLGFFVGIFLFGGFAFQVVGLNYTTASKAGFLTGLSVVIVPILSAVILKKIPSILTIVGVILAAVGLGLLSFNGQFIFNFGDFLVFLCAISLAVYILLVGKYVQQKDSILLTIVQITTVALLSGIASLLEGSFKVVMDPELWGAVVYMALFATTFALVVQNKAQEFTTPTRTAIIFSMEPVFAAIFAYFYLGEIISTNGYWGGLLIVIGMFVAELKLSKPKEEVA